MGCVIIKVPAGPLLSLTLQVQAQCLLLTPSWSQLALPMGFVRQILIRQALTYPTGCQTPCWALGDSSGTKADEVLFSQSSESGGRRPDSRYGHKQNESSAW